MDHSQNNIDPGSFTAEELMKHIYRKLNELSVKLDQYETYHGDDKKVQDDQIAQNKLEIVKLRTTLEEKDKSFKIFLTIITIGLSLLTLILKYVG